MLLLDGRKAANQIYQEMQLFLSETSLVPCLAALLVGDNPASHLYVKSKVAACQRIGILSKPLLLPASTSQKELLTVIEELNRDRSVHGILVQLPLPPHLDAHLIAESLDPSKDVDGVHPINVGKALLGQAGGYLSCTPLGIKLLLKHYGIATPGRHVVIAGRSNIVGKPLAALLVQKEPDADATVTLVHSSTKNLAEIALQADILIAAIGQAHFFTADMINKNTVVIDVGQNRLLDPAHPKGFRLVGDVDYNAVASQCAAITPVPGGVGPMTIASLLSNTVLAAQRANLK